MRALSAGELAAVAEVAAAVGIPPHWLAGLIEFETAGTWDPQIKNPGSSATGLLQFIDQTARELGYGSSAELARREPTVDQQLRGAVRRYLEARAPFESLQALAMSVFFPAYRTAPSSTSFPGWVQAANPGIETVADYVRRVESRAAKWAAAFASVPVVSAAAAVASSPAVWLALAALLAVLVWRSW